MSGASSLFQLWQCPPTKLLLLKSSRLYGGIGDITCPKSYSIQCLCRGLQTTAYEVVNGSYIPTAQITEENRAKTSITVEKSTKLEHMGAFQKLPMVMPSADIFYSAVKKSKRIAPTKGIANIAKRERNRGAKQLDALMKELTIPLRMYLEQFPKKNYLHPYERSLIELTLGDGNYEEVLGKINNLRKKVVSVGKEHAALCAKSSSKRDAEERLIEGMKRVEEVYSGEAKAVDDLLDIAKTLRAMPVVDLETPTLCLVGAPNVGKSSLVRVLSTGKPEVCNYPFTTRGILMGHIVLDYQHFQVTDTPGLLNRSDDDRNNLEKLTLAVLSHLPTAILYVHDLSGECGTSPSDQFILYKEIKKRFGDHLWLDVVSKCDLLLNISATSHDRCENSDLDLEHYKKLGPAGALYVSDLELEHYKKLGPAGALYVSLKNELGVVELKDRVHKQLVSQMARIKDPNSNQEA